MNSAKSESKRSFPSGWILVLGIVLLTPVLHAFIITTSYRGAAAGQALRIASGAIGIRAIIGIFRRDSSRKWVIYAVLYPFLIVITAALSAVFYGHS